MKYFVLFISLVILAITLLGQTNTPPTLYVHVGFGYGTNAEPLLCAPIHIGKSITVTNDDSFQLTGTIEQQGTNLVAKNLKWWKNGSGTLYGYRGPVTLEKPVFGGSAGTSLMPTWIIVSTNLDNTQGLEKLKEMEKSRQQNDNGQ